MTIPMDYEETLAEFKNDRWFDARYKRLREALEFAVKENQQLRKDNEELRKQNEWQDISTAPRDGTRILAKITNRRFYMEDKICIVRWSSLAVINPQRLEPPPTVIGFWLTGEMSPIECDPTHWLPLPKPPTSEVK